MSTLSTREARLRRHRRIRGKVRGTKERPRLAVFRSNRGIFAQLIDDENGQHPGRLRLAAAEGVLGRQDRAGGSGWEATCRGGEGSGLTTCVFDRGGYLYHGRVKALADGAREGGLEF